MQYGEIFEKAGVMEVDPNDVAKNQDFIPKFNQEALKKSIHNLKDADEVTSIYVNYPALLLRKKSELYPDGRTSQRFK
jgi:hypothetical protein